MPFVSQSRRKRRACTAAGVIAATVTLALAGPAHAYLYFHTVELEIPANALPPGPANAELLATQNDRHLVRFIPDAGRPTRLRLYRFDYHFGNKQAEAHSESGPARWQGEATPEKTGGLLFVGAPELHGELVRILMNSAERDPQLRSLGGLVVISAAESLRERCKRMVDAELVVAVTGPELGAADLLTCVARGAAVVALAPERPAAFASLPTGKQVFFGAGSLSVVITTAAAASEAALAYNQRYQWRGILDSALGFAQRYEETTEPEHEPKGPSGGHVVLVALGCYLGLIVMGGIWISRRARPAWQGWGWFPAVAFGFALVLAALGSSWGHSQALAKDLEVRVLSPTHSGVALRSFRVETDAAEVYTFSIPWTADSVLKHMDRSHRFGNPFAPTIDGLLLREDRIARRLEVERLAMNRRDVAGMVWHEPLPMPTTPIARLERRSDGELWATHRAKRAPVRSLLCGHAGEMAPADWPPGQAIRFAPVANRPAPSAEEPDAVFRTIRNQLCAHLPPESFVIMLDLDETPATRPAGAAIQPAIPLRRRTVEIDIGPVAPEGASPSEGTP